MRDLVRRIFDAVMLFRATIAFCLVPCPTDAEALVLVPVVVSHFLLFSIPRTAELCLLPLIWPQPLEWASNPWARVPCRGHHLLESIHGRPEPFKMESTLAANLSVSA